ncbi:hypothetical protein ABW21_db0206326 [Orbilia brochopaga]|nr:hypothetical protein ABW21_db0206326 [Drechslerella brochopaga]
MRLPYHLLYFFFVLGSFQLACSANQSPLHAHHRAVHVILGANGRSSTFSAPIHPPSYFSAESVSAPSNTSIQNRAGLGNLHYLRYYILPLWMQRRLPVGYTPSNLNSRERVHIKL